MALALAAAEVTHLCSSPAIRCVQTLEPAARQLGTTVEAVRALGEGRPGARVLALIETLSAATALCTHGDVIAEVLDLLARRGVIQAAAVRAAKASRWELRLEVGTVVAARYREPVRGRAPGRD
ncbi:MAG: hypothetical protein NVSMB29_17840 [Candidatus Dormibacteria bacterium]